MIDERTIGRSQRVHERPQRFSWRAYLIAAIVGGLVGVALALVTAWWLVSQIDPKTGMGI